MAGGGGQRNPLLASFLLFLKFLLRSSSLVMASRSLLPTDAELALLATVEQVRVWAGLDNGVWQRVSEFLGTLPSLRVFSLVPLATLREMPTRLRLPQPAVSGVEQPPRSLTAVEIIQVAIMWRVARQAFGLPDIDPLITDPAVVASPAPKAVAASGAKKVKVSSHADQLDESEVDMISQEDLEQLYRNYRQLTGADPQPESDPTPEQVTVLRNKVLVAKEAPYADFSVLTPYGRRVQKQMKAKGFHLQQDGTWKSTEIPGPPTMEAWKSCWRIYRTVLLMIKHPPNAAGDQHHVVTIAALEEYHDKICELNNEFPECWHLLLQAEDRCRGEQFERCRRLLNRAFLEGSLPMGLSYSADQPWSSVFTYAARDQEYWNRNVVRPAQTFLARGGSGKKMTRSAAEDFHLTESEVQAIKKDSLPGEGVSRAARKRRREKEKAEERKRATDSWNGSAGYKGGGKSKDAKGGGGHPRKSGKEFQTDRDGNQICFKFAKGQPGSCQEPCPDSRTHCCQYCLGAHPNVQCTNGGGKGSKK